MTLNGKQNCYSKAEKCVIISTFVFVEQEKIKTLCVKIERKKTEKAEEEEEGGGGEKEKQGEKKRF